MNIELSSRICNLYEHHTDNTYTQPWRHGGNASIRLFAQCFSSFSRFLYCNLQMSLVFFVYLHTIVSSFHNFHCFFLHFFIEKLVSLAAVAVPMGIRSNDRFMAGKLNILHRIKNQNDISSVDTIDKSAFRSLYIYI